MHGFCGSWQNLILSILIISSKKKRSLDPKYNSLTSPLYATLTWHNDRLSLCENEDQQSWTRCFQIVFWAQRRKFGSSLMSSGTDFRVTGSCFNLQRKLCTAFLCHSYQFTLPIYSWFCLVKIHPIILHRGRNFGVRHEENRQMAHKGMWVYWTACQPSRLFNIMTSHGNMGAVLPIGLLTPDSCTTGTSHFSESFLCD